MVNFLTYSSKKNILNDIILKEKCDNILFVSKNLS